MKMSAQKGLTVIDLALLAAICTVAALIVLNWIDWSSPTVTLKIKDWDCTRNEERAYQYPMMVGKVTMLQTGRRMECVEWQRKPD